MRRVLTLFLFLFTSAIFAQITQEDLMKDIVVIKEGRYTITHNYLVETEGVDQNLQLSLYAESPTSAMSRDNIVAFSVMILEMITQSMASGNKFELHDLDEIIGNADVAITLYFAKQGVRIEAVTQEGNFSETMRWEDF